MEHNTMDGMTIDEMTGIIANMVEDLLRKSHNKGYLSGRKKGYDDAKIGIETEKLMPQFGYCPCCGKKLEDK